MSSYVFIESRDPFSSNDASFVSDTAVELKQRGHDVSVYLIQNGVLGAREAAQGSHIPQLVKAGVTLLADDFSLQERGINGDEMNAVVRPCEIDELVDLLADQNTKAIWH